jgi:hypothetical protein
MTDQEYTHYLVGREFQYFGGKANIGKNVIKAPRGGKWHLVIDNNNTNESINVALQITNGRQIFENEYIKDNEDNEDNEAIEEREMAKRGKTRKTSSNKGNKKKNEKDYRKHFQKEILNIIKKIDEEGLTLLIEQATILLQNQKIHELNEKIQHYNEKSIRKKKKTVKTDKAKSHAKEGTLIDIEQQSDNAFILVLNDTRKVLSRIELRNIIGMCHSPMNDIDFSRKLYDWLTTSRNDILFDLKIRSAQHPLWPLLRRFIRNRFRARES